MAWCRRPVLQSVSRLRIVLSLPRRIISHAVWLYFRFHLSLRDVEELLAERGIIVTYETIRAWCAEFGPNYAAGLCRRPAQPSDKWHLDEVQLKINGKRHWLWRADRHVVPSGFERRQSNCASNASRSFGTLSTSFGYMAP
jgi:transposase-like protein